MRGGVRDGAVVAKCVAIIRAYWASRKSFVPLFGAVLTGQGRKPPLQ